MIVHTVLLHPKEETTQEEIEAALEQVRALQQKIAGIKSVVAGANLHTGRNTHGYTSGFVLVFETPEHFRAYAPHPAHQPVSRELQRICESIIDFDLLQN